MNTTEVCDRLEINTVLDDFVIGQDKIFGTFPIRMDRAAADAVLNLFAPEGVLHTPFGRSEGRDAIRANWERVAAFDAPEDGPKYVSHHITSRATTFLDATTARATVYHQAITDRGLDHWGYYEDRLIKLTDGWRFAERLVIVQDWVPGGYYAGLPNPQNPVPTW
jgi:hypothetical protein